MLASTTNRIRRVRFFNGHRLIGTDRTGVAGLYSITWRAAHAAQGPASAAGGRGPGPRAEAARDLACSFACAGSGRHRRVERDRRGASPASSAEQDWVCVVVGRREDRLRDGRGGDRRRVRGAATSPIATRSWRMADAVRERHPEIGLLVNNAGDRGSRQLPRPGAGADRGARAHQLPRLGLVPACACCRRSRPAAPSHVVNVVSVAGTVAIGPYSASKHAQLAFSRSVARELRPRGIHVHTVNPGFVHTEGFPQDWLLRGALRPASWSARTW